MTLEGLHQFAVEHPKFRLSSTRAKIMQNLWIVAGCLCRWQIRADLWIDGSFLTEKIDPDDVDLLIVVEEGFAASAAPEQLSIMEWLCEDKNQPAKAAFLFDSYANYKTFDIDPGHQDYLALDLYWRSQFGISRRGEEKGMALISVPGGLHMNAMLEIQDKLRESTAMIARLEKSLAVHQSPSIAASLRSLYKLHGAYEEEFRVAAEVNLIDVVHYRLFEGNGRPTVSLVGKALENFQSLYTILYAVASGGHRKDTAHITPDVVNNAAFEFAYSYSGSLAFVFTLPNERLLFGETALDEAMKDLFMMAKADGTEAVRDFGRRFGLAPVRATYKWVASLAASRVGVEIEWRKSESIKQHVVLQPAEVEELRNLIDKTSDLDTYQYEINGTLRGFDPERSFRFEPSDDSGMLRGSVADSVELPPRVVMPQTYAAKIRTTTRIRYATEQSEISHELIGLKLLT